MKNNTINTVRLRNSIADSVSVNWNYKKPSLIVDQMLLRDPRVHYTFSLFGQREQITIQYDFKQNQRKLDEDITKSDGGVHTNIPYNYWLGNKKELWKTSKDNLPFCYEIPEETSVYFNDPYPYWILKNNQQRQQGLYLVEKHSNQNWMGKRHPSQEWMSKNHIIVAQKYISDPMLYNGHKFNLRLYLTVKVTKTGVNYWLSNDGIIYYAPETYLDPSVNFSKSRHIPSFYKSKPLFEKGFPNTWKSMLKSWSLTTNDGERVLDECHKIVRELLVCYQQRLENEGKIDEWIKNHICWEFFGLDFFLDKTGKPSLIEINLGPGLTPYNTIDGQVRARAVQKYLDSVIESAKDIHT